MFDGGPGAEPPRPVNAWLVSDDRAELIREIRELAHASGVRPGVASYIASHGGETLRVDPHPVIHTSHPTYGYLISDGGGEAVWAPEYWEFPSWVSEVDLMFADAAGWTRPIHFAGRVGGHASVSHTAHLAELRGVRRLVFAHIGRPSIRAIDTGADPPFGEWGIEGRRYQLRAHRRLPDRHQGYTTAVSREEERST